MDDRFELGQIVECGGLNYEIICISLEPCLIFGDGSRHYIMTLRLCNGEYDDVIYVNDAQLGG